MRAGSGRRSSTLGQTIYPRGAEVRRQQHSSGQGRVRSGPHVEWRSCRRHGHCVLARQAKLQPRHSGWKRKRVLPLSLGAPRCLGRRWVEDGAPRRLGYNGHSQSSVGQRLAAGHRIVVPACAQLLLDAPRRPGRRRAWLAAVPVSKLRARLPGRAPISCLAQRVSAVLTTEQSASAMLHEPSLFERWTRFMPPAADPATTAD